MHCQQMLMPVEELELPFIYSPQLLKLSEAPVNSSVPAVPALLIVKDIKLNAPSAVGILGEAPEGNKNAVVKPMVVIPEFVILTCVRVSLFTTGT